MACATCDIIRGLLMAKGVNPLVIESTMPLIELAETKAKKVIKKRTRKQRAMDSRRSEAWSLANAKGRRKNGEFYAGWDQKRIADYANKVLRRS